MAVASPLKVPSMRSIGAVAEEALEFEQEAADVPTDLTKGVSTSWQCRPYLLFYGCNFQQGTETRKYMNA